MTEAPDPLMQRLARLSSAAPDIARADRVRSRCHAALARRRAIGATDVSPGRLAGRAVELTLVAGFCLTYLAVVIRHAWQIVG